MKFVIIGWDGPEGQSKRPLHRPAHLERLKALQEKGQLICAGPFSDQAGSLIIIEAESLDEAEAFSQGDPYVKEGIFKRVEVHPFTQVLPEEPG
ncbi:YciI family protein [Candidatus Nitronereus thalassa]|uniref:YciI family protein n=1 Tax=Candidatus Nitronereus thalassa TaxID=3020898 RepID=A0ABU3KAG8_9BACT|nr:YciI family protein [Candidatus Nitronereus thalassa]MDT7043416.1 YciI family protein [Candidatus Nitronereus thalassa]